MRQTPASVLLIEIIGFLSCLTLDVCVCVNVLQVNVLFLKAFLTSHTYMILLHKTQNHFKVDTHFYSDCHWWIYCKMSQLAVWWSVPEQWTEALVGKGNVMSAKYSSRTNCHVGLEQYSDAFSQNVQIHHGRLVIEDSFFIFFFWSCVVKFHSSPVLDLICCHHLFTEFSGFCAALDICKTCKPCWQSLSSFLIMKWYTYFFITML